MERRTRRWLAARLHRFAAARGRRGERGERGRLRSGQPRNFGVAGRGRPDPRALRAGSFVARDRAAAVQRCAVRAFPGRRSRGHAEAAARWTPAPARQDRGSGPQAHRHGRGWRADGHRRRRNRKRAPGPRLGCAGLHAEAEARQGAEGFERKLPQAGALTGRFGQQRGTRQRAPDGDREMNRDLLMIVESVAAEKAVPHDVIFGALEAALATAAKKRYPDEEPDIRVAIDQETGDYETFRRWEVIADDGEMESPDWQLRLMDAEDERPGAQVGEYIEQQIENPEFGRITAQAAKQVIVQRIREAERAQVVDAFKDRVGELVNGVAKRVERGNIYLDLGGKAEAFIPRDKAIPREVVRVGDRVRGYLFEVRSELRGPQLFVSRTAPEFMMELFKLEVPEVGQGIVEIKACARDAGDRA